MHDSPNCATPTTMCKSAQTCPQFFVLWSKLEPKGAGNVPKRVSKSIPESALGPCWCQGGAQIDFEGFWVLFGSPFGTRMLKISLWINSWKCSFQSCVFLAKIRSARASSDAKKRQTRLRAFQKQCVSQMRKKYFEPPGP